MTLCFLLSTAAFTTAFCFHSVYISEEITSIFKEISVRKSAWQKLCGSCVVTPAWWPPRALLLTGILFLPHGSAKGRQAEPSGGPRPFSPRVQTCQFEISKSFREIPSLDLNRHLQCFDFMSLFSPLLNSISFCCLIECIPIVETLERRGNCEGNRQETLRNTHNATLPRQTLLLVRLFP